MKKTYHGERTVKWLKYTQAPSAWLAAAPRVSFLRSDWETFSKPVTLFTYQFPICHMNLIVRLHIESLGGREIMHIKHLDSSIFLFSFLNLNLLGWHWLRDIYRFQVYISAIRVLYIVLCAQHPSKSRSIFKSQLRCCFCSWWESQWWASDPPASLQGCYFELRWALVLERSSMVSGREGTLGLEVADQFQFGFPHTNMKTWTCFLTFWVWIPRE